MLYMIVKFSWVASVWIAAAVGTFVGWLLGRWVYKDQVEDYERFGPATLSLNSITIKAIIMEVRIHPRKEVPLTLGKPVKKNGDPGEIEEGTLAIEVTDLDGNPTDLATWERDDQAANPDDPYTGKVVWRGPGKAILRQKGDSDLGDGVETIEHDTTLTLLDEDAVDFIDPTVGTERDHVEESEQA